MFSLEASIRDRRMWLTTKDGARFIDDGLNMDGKLFGLGGDITTRGDDDERVCLAVRVL